MNKKELKRCRRSDFRILLLFAIVCLSSVCHAGNKKENQYREIIDALKWGNDSVIVVGHKNPDCDATCSAIAYAYLMNATGHKCTPRVINPINMEMKYASKALGFKTPMIQESVPEGQQLILTDHSNYAQSIKGAEKAQILQIIDHHNIGDVTSSKPIFCKIIPVGSACTAVYTSFKELDVAIPDDIAKVILTGIVSDTKNLTTAGIAIDSIALNEMARQLGMSSADIDSLDKHMRIAAETYPEEMSDSAIYESDYKNYPAVDGIKIGIATTYWHDSRTIDQFLRRMKDISATIMKEEDRDMVFAMVHKYKPNTTGKDNSDYLPDGTYLVYFGKGAKEIAEEAYGKSVGDAWVYSAERQSRKGSVVPKIISAIHKIKSK